MLVDPELHEAVDWSFVRNLHELVELLKELGFCSSFQKGRGHPSTEKLEVGALERRVLKDEVHALTGDRKLRVVRGVDRKKRGRQV